MNTNNTTEQDMEDVLLKLSRPELPELQKQIAEREAELQRPLCFTNGELGTFLDARGWSWLEYKQEQDATTVTKPRTNSAFSKMRATYVQEILDRIENGPLECSKSGGVWIGDTPAKQ